MILSSEVSKAHRNAKKVGRPAVSCGGGRRKVHTLSKQITCRTELSAVMLWAGPWRRHITASHHPNLLLQAPSAPPHKTMWNAHIYLKNPKATVNQALQKSWGAKGMGGMKVVKKIPEGGWELRQELGREKEAADTAGTTGWRCWSVILIIPGKRTVININDCGQPLCNYSLTFLKLHLAATAIHAL